MQKKNKYYNLRVIICYCVVRNMNNEEIFNEMTKTFGFKSLSLSFVEKWARRFRNGETSFYDMKRNGRKTKHIDLCEKIKDRLKEFPFESTRTLSINFHCSEETIRKTLVNKLKYKKYTSKWIPHQLKFQHKLKRVNFSTSLHEFLCMVPDLGNVITSDESWFFYENQHDSQWCSSKNDVIAHVKNSNFSKKTMIIIFWNFQGFFYVDFLKKKETIDSDFIKSKLEILKKKWNEYYPEKRNEKLFLHWDNASSHKSSETYQTVSELGLIELPHPPYSPDIAPSDFFLFGYLKRKLRDWAINSFEDLVFAISTEMIRISKEVLENVFNNWLKRLEKVITENGEYYSK